MLKICTGCGKELPATGEYFHKHSQSKDGLRSKCKECRHKERVNYYNNHEDESRIYNQIYNALHKTKKKKELDPEKKELYSKLFLEC